jgi:CDP-4-dehydro-6-deoxyglucose reductase, E3
MSFIVRTEPGNHAVEVAPGETILAAALRQGVALPYGCRNGQCGSCAAILVEGELAYPDGKTEALEARPAGTCLPCQAVPLSDLILRVVEVRAIAQVEVRLLPCRLERKEQLNHDVMRLYLKLPENQRLQFFAGQYLDFILQDGRKRAFSIANAPHDDALIELHVRHVPGGLFTDHVFHGLAEKTILRIQAPLGTFILHEDSERPMLFIGGGTGFAPLKGMIEHAMHRGIRRPMHLYWGVRARRDLYLPGLPELWARDWPAFSYTPVLSEPDADWTGRAGFVHEAVAADYPDLRGFDIYMSGPPAMVEAGRIACEACGATMDHMFSDAFTYAKDGSGSPDAVLVP